MYDNFVAKTERKRQQMVNKTIISQVEKYLLNANILPKTVFFSKEEFEIICRTVSDLENDTQIHLEFNNIYT